MKKYTGTYFFQNKNCNKTRHNIGKFLTSSSSVFMSVVGVICSLLNISPSILFRESRFFYFLLSAISGLSLLRYKSPCCGIRYIVQPFPATLGAPWRPTRGWRGSRVISCMSYKGVKNLCCMLRWKNFCNTRQFLYLHSKLCA